MDDASSTWRILVALGLVVLNAFLVAAQYAVVTVRSGRLRELADKGDRAAITAAEITEHLDSYLLACQLGISAASIGIGWIVQPALRSWLSPLFGALGWTAQPMAVAAAIGFILVCFVHAVIGEQLPKLFSINRAEAAALRFSPFLRLYHRLLFPIIWLINTTASGILSLFGMQYKGFFAERAPTEEEIRAIVSTSQEYGVLEEHEVELVENVLDYSDRVAREIMTPRNDVVVLYTDQSLAQAAEFVLAEGYTRYPLCKEQRDHVVGIVHIRDIFKLCLSGETKSLEEIAREPLIIPETLTLPAVRAKFQNSGVHMAVVVDEYGSFSGVVTLEDLVEEVFGDLRDEFDEDEPETVRATEKGLELDAGMLVEEALEAMGVTGDVDVEGVDTIGGLVFSLLADRPQVGDNVQVDGYRLEVAELDGLRITRIIAVPLSELEKEPAPDASAQPADNDAS